MLKTRKRERDEETANAIKKIKAFDITPASLNEFTALVNEFKPITKDIDTILDFRQETSW